MSNRIKNVADHLPSLDTVIDYDAVLSGNGKCEQIRSAYYRGLMAAKSGDLELAETLLEEARRRPDIGAAASRALAEVYRCKAGQCLAQDDMAGAVSILTKARECDPANERVAELLKELGNAVPVLHVLGGRRESADETWTKALTEEPSNLDAARSLAILHFFWAREHLDAARTSDAAKSWKRSAECWSMVLRSSEFAEQWAGEKSKIYGRSVDLSHIQDACTRVGEAILREIMASAEHFRGSHDDPNCKIVLEAYAEVLGGLRAAEWLAEAARAYDGELPPGFILGGPSALARCGRLPQAQEVISHASEGGMDRQIVRKAQIAFSGQAPEWCFVEAKQYDRAIEQTEKIGSRSKEQNEVLATAYVESAALLRDEEGSERAFQLWVRAAGIAGRSMPDITSQIEKYAITAAAPASRRSKNTSVAVVRRIVQDMKQLAKSCSGKEFKVELSDALEQLAIKEFNDGSKTSAETHLEEAIKYNSGNQSAKRVLSAIYSGRAVDVFNAAGPYSARSAASEACGLLVKALDYDPSNQHALKNARELIRQMMNGGMLSEASELLGKIGLHGLLR